MSCSCLMAARLNWGFEEYFPLFSSKTPRHRSWSILSNTALKSLRMLMFSTLAAIAKALPLHLLSPKSWR